MSREFSLFHANQFSTQKAKQVQQELACKIIIEDQFKNPQLVAGVDVGFLDNGTITCAAIAVLSYPALELVDKAIIKTTTKIPYIPGYLSFRELPAVMAAIKKLQCTPDMYLCDGQGIAHPRRFGIACHMGLLTNTPSIGVAKSRLIGTYTEPAIEKGAFSNLYDKDEKIGVVLRTRSNVKPLFISPGHMISIESAMKYVLQCTTRYKLPETTRQAHKLASG